MTCEKCWADAYAEMIHRGGNQTDHYWRLIRERNETHTECSKREQAGQFWDEALGIDRRLRPPSAPAGETT